MHLHVLVPDGVFDDDGAFFDGESAGGHRRREVDGARLGREVVKVVDDHACVGRVVLDDLARARGDSAVNAVSDGAFRTAAVDDRRRVPEACDALSVCAVCAAGACAADGAGDATERRRSR